MEPMLKIFQTVDELEENGVPKQTKEDLKKFSQNVSEYCVNYVNEPSVGLWHIQNHIHNKILPKNSDIKSHLLQTLQDSREISLELGSVSNYVPSSGNDGDCNTLMSETLGVCKNVNKILNRMIETKEKKIIKNKAVDDVIVESVVKEAIAKEQNGRARANSFEQWYKDQFKS